MTIETRLAEIRARAENATEGPWESELPPGPGEDPMRPICIYPKGDGGVIAYVQPLDADAKFLAHTRTDVPALLAAVEAVKKRADRWTSLDRPEGDDFHGGFNAGVKFAAGHILRDITTALEVQG